MLCRNQAYQARIQLAVLDNNAHCTRDPAYNKSGAALYARKYRKQSKKWDATPIKKRKDYNYMPKIIDTIEEQQYNFSGPLKKKRPLPQGHPAHIQATIGDSQPTSTSIIVQNKRSRFS